MFILCLSKIEPLEVEEHFRQAEDLRNQLSDIRYVLGGTPEALLDGVEDTVCDIEPSALNLLGRGSERLKSNKILCSDGRG